mmetsp:Transcript_47919/g.145735  ORF Transcript_47919/g.145735 Transcript_47919/m.145735 type:complete len:204 (-) Transcript_47919:295-906(-)
MALLLLRAGAVLHGLQRHVGQAERHLRRLLGADGVEADRRGGLQRDLLRVVEAAPRPVLLRRGDARGLQLPPLLQRGEAPRLLQLFLPGLPLRLLTAGVRQPRPGLRQHLLFVFVHIDGVCPSWLGLRVGVDLSGLQAPRVILVHLVPALGLVEQLLVMLEALISCPAHDGRDRPPLGGEQLGEVQELLFFLPGPLRLLDARV